MEEIVRIQTALGKEIEKLANAYYAESPDKKTLTYLKEKLTKLQQAWQEFDENDTKIRHSFDTAQHRNHNYFLTDYYANVKLVVEKVEKEIKALIATVEHHRSNSVSDGAGSSEKKVKGASNLGINTQEKPKAVLQLDNIQKSIRKEEGLIETLERILDNIQDLQEAQSRQYYTVKLEIISKYWNQIETLHENIWENAESFEEIGYNQDKFFGLQKKYHDVLIKFATEQSLLQDEKGKEVLNQNRDVPTIKLPKIQLPKFDGSYLKWQQFFDLFNQLVHNQPMGNAQKMFYLKSNLVGEAERLIRHIPVSDDNYESAWEVLRNRYSNKRLLVTALLEKLLSQSTVVNESAATIKNLHDCTKECILGLENLGISVYKHWDPILLHVLLKKLDKTTHTLYEQSLQTPRELQSLRRFLEFLELRFQALEALGQKRSIENKQVSRASTHTITKGNRLKCSYCSKEHAIYYCEQFLKLTVDNKQAVARKLNLCLNCLKQGHRAINCSMKGCLKCNQKHNTLLHQPDNKHLQQATTHLGSNDELQPQVQVLQGDNNSYVFLGTATAFVKDNQGKPVKCRILLDSGSQVSFITEKLRRRLKIPSIREELNVTGIGETKIKTSDRINITIQSNNKGYETVLEVYVMKDITCQQPQKFINTTGWNIPQNITLADSGFYRPDKVDILIGAELYGDIMLNGHLKLGEGLPILQNTTMGWIVLGKVSSSNYATPFCGITNNQLDNQMKRFWELEECTVDIGLSPADKRCEEFFAATTHRNSEGRYIVNLPILTEPSLLGNSWNIAYRRFQNMEKKLTKNAELYKSYNEFLMEYLQLGHMKEISYKEIPTVHYFLPHHYVLKPSSSTTKLRVVFDASAKTTNNLSLNDLMMAGPRIQDELFDIILRFRTYKYVFTADIAQMYRQILINEEDRNLQLIMWRNQPTEPMRYFQLCTVTYGTKAAPYLATRCLKKLAEDEEQRYPLGAKTIKDFYVDDVISGHDSITEAIKIQSELNKMLKTGGFRLRKWCANHPALLKDIPKEDLEVVLNFSNHDEDHIKTLGLSWEPKRDLFTFSTTWPERVKVTKRSVLADISQLFDPLGIVNPVVVLGKIFMQQLWSLELEWDQELPSELRDKWADFREGLSCLHNLKINRYIINGTMTKKIELHAFADASERAYGAAVYVRSINLQGQILVKLFCAKSRVAPRKFVTLPRLELCAARLASQLVSRVTKAITCKIDQVTYWSDSLDVLSWINGEPALLKTFVANRVQQIQELTLACQWKYINTKLNPADLVSRGLTPQRLVESKLWFHGPPFLQNPESEWPKSEVEIKRNTAEERVMKSVLNCNNNNNEDFIDRINHGNSFRRLQRIVAYILRAIKLMKGNLQKTNCSNFLTVLELDEALGVIVRKIQIDSCKEEIQDLKTRKVVKGTSRLSSLSPFLDHQGLLRVGGRLEAAEIPYSAKHPLLLVGEHRLSRLLLNYLHIQHFHAGPQALVAISRQRFWITQGRAVARSIVNGCIQCTRAKPQTMTQVMGDLPASRVLPGRPFLTTGIDFCGPIWTHYKVRGKRPHKSYVAVFCCFVTKAVHLEVVSDLSTDAFIGALKRFVARRGYCKDIYCDNATNFVGANNKLKEVQEMLEQRESKERISDVCLEKNIQFHFSPPRSPHFGGLWEAAVKSFKQLFVKTVAPASLTFEELSTVSAEIEAILNSRPLTPMSSNANDLTALTPGHFLVGEALVALPEVETTAKMSSLSRWKLVSWLKQEFWRRWTTEYLAELQKRVKWTQNSPNIKIGTLVLIKEDNLPSLKWPMGRVVSVHPGADGNIRVAEVRTASGVYKRAIHNLCPLPIETSDDIENQAHVETDPLLKRPNEDPADEERRGRKTRRVSSTLGALLLTCLLLPLSTIAAPTKEFIQIKKFNNQPGIYYEGLGHASISTHDWKLLIYYDMSNYWKMWATIEKSVKKLEIIANMSKNQEYLKAITMQYKHTISEIEEMNELLISHQGLRPRDRTKRGLINAVGMLSRKLFGVLDEDYAAEVKETIEKVQNNEDHLLQLLKNQTSVIEATDQVIKRSEEERLKQATIIQRTFEDNMEKFKNLDERMKEQELTQSFITLTTFISSIISEYQNIQETLINTITDVHHGKMNPRIISAVKLREQLTTIAEHLPGTLSVPSRDIAHLYQIMSVKCHVNTDFTIFVAQLPLALKEKFELYKLIPLPSLVNGSYVSITPTTELLMVNLERDILYPLSMLDFTQCATLGEKEYLCPQLHPIVNKNADSLKCEAEMINSQGISEHCAITISPPGRTWIQLSDSNRWLFSIDREYIYNFVCNNIAFHQGLSGTGMLTFQGECVMKDDNIIIKSHTVSETELTAAFFPNFNLSERIIIPHGLNLPNHTTVTIPYRDHIQELTRLQESLRDIEDQEQLPNNVLSYHHIHQYTMGYATLGLTILIGVCVGYIYRKVKSGKWIQSSTSTHQSSHLTMPADVFKIELKEFKGGEDVRASSK